MKQNLSLLQGLENQSCVFCRAFPGLNQALALLGSPPIGQIYGNIRSKADLACLDQFYSTSFSLEGWY